MTRCPFCVRAKFVSDIEDVKTVFPATYELFLAARCSLRLLRSRDRREQTKTLVTKPLGLGDYLALRVPLPSVRTSRTQCARAEHCLMQSSVTVIKQACFLRGA